MLVIPRHTSSDHDPKESLWEEVNIVESGQGHLHGPVSCPGGLSKGFYQQAQAGNGTAVRPTQASEASSLVLGPK